MLSERAQILLKTLVERYIADGQPVGSRTLSRYSGLESVARPASATSWRTSRRWASWPARTPRPAASRRRAAIASSSTRLLTVRPLDRVEINQLEGQLQPRSDRRSCCSRPRTCLSDLTRFAGVVMTPRRRSTRAPPRRVPAPVGQAHPADHRHPRRRRAEPHPVHRSHLHALRADRGGQFPQPELRRPDLRGGQGAPARRAASSCATT